MNDPHTPAPGDVLIRPSSTGPRPGADPPTGPNRQRIVAIGAAAAVVLVGVVIALIVSLGSGDGDGGTDASGEHRSADTGDATGGPLDLDTSGTTTMPAGDAGAAATADPATGGDTAAGAAPAPGAAGAGGGAGVLVPRAGPYTYKGTGSEKTLPFLPNPIPQGPTKPASVADAGGGCWRLDIEQNANHTDSATFCAGGDGSLVLQSMAVRQVNDLGQLGRITSNLTTSCPTPVTVVSPGMAPGASFPLNCTNHTVVDKGQAPADMGATGTVTFVGVENVSIGGVPVAAYHVRQNVRLIPSDGAPEGKREADVWIATDDGMVLRESRSMTASAKLFGVVSTYSETSEHTLASR